MRFTIYIDPQAKERPRFNPFSKQVTAYTPKKTTEFQEEVRRVVTLEFSKTREFPIYPGGVPLEVNVDLVFKRIGKFKPKKYGDGLQWKPTKPDFDNVVKAVLDALNGVLWEDDAQVVKSTTQTFYAERYGKPRVCILVRRAGDVPRDTLDNWSLDTHNRLAGVKDGEEDEII